MVSPKTTLVYGALSAFLFSGLNLPAARLLEVRPVDESVLMVSLRDGEVFFRDDGAGERAFSGHDFAPGDDWMVRYGEPLDGAAAKLPGNWRLRSEDDADYADGLSPATVSRKAKVFHTTHDWEYALDHTVFLHLSEPLDPGATYTLEIAPGTGADTTESTFTYELGTTLSEAIHVNLLGYTPESAVKSADLYLWLGDGGPRDYSGFEGRAAWLREVSTGETFPVGEVTFWKPLVTEAEDRSLTGSPVWTVDFSDFERPGRYRLVVDGVGASAEFAIAKDHWREPFRASVEGFYYMRIGEPVDAADPPPRQPRFLPEEDPLGFTIYLTDLDPLDPLWHEIPGDTWGEPHHKLIRDSIFWEHRLPGNPTTLTAVGGHSDALDWDRHLGHVSIIYDMLLPFIVSGGTIDDDDLGLPESGNGIPDLLDEARNEVDFWLNVRVGEAYAHGLTNPSKDRTAMFQAGVTNLAAWANAANCAMLAEALRMAGQEALMAHYRDEAIRAYRFAGAQEDLQLDERQSVGNTTMRGRDFRMTAASYLYAVTGDREWEDALVADSVVREGIDEIEKTHEWDQSWATAAYLFTSRKRHYMEVAEKMYTALRRQALADNVRLMDERPSRRSSDHNYFQTTQDLQLVLMAHALEEDPAMRERMERAMILEADWGLGRNPTNTVEMTGLGSRHIVNCYTSGRNDGVPGLHPGHTPYNNLGSWGGTHIGSNPQWFAERGYPAWEDGWPHQEAFFNSRYSWANGEFTPQQTMRAKMALYGYLYTLSLQN